MEDAVVNPEVTLGTRIRIIEAHEDYAYVKAGMIGTICNGTVFHADDYSAMDRDGSYWITDLCPIGEHVRVCFSPNNCSFEIISEEPEKEECQESTSETKEPTITKMQNDTELLSS